MDATPKEKFLTVKDYFAVQEPKNRKVLEIVRKTISKVTPGAEEVISYQMPAFKFKKIVVWYAVHKNHYALYPYSKTIEVFKDKLQPYKLSKGTIQFPLDEPVPVDLIQELVEYRVSELMGKPKTKNLKNSKTDSR